MEIEGDVANCGLLGVQSLRQTPDQQQNQLDMAQKLLTITLNSIGWRLS